MYSAAFSLCVSTIVEKMWRLQQLKREVWTFLDYEMHRNVEVEDLRIAAETEHNRESAAYADCWLSGLRWTIKLSHNVAPMLWLWVDIRLTVLDYLCRRDVGGRQRSSASDEKRDISGHMLYFMSSLGSTNWTRPTLTATSASHLPFSHEANVCSHK